MGNLGTTEIILIALVFVVFFGAKKIPELAQGLGQGHPRVPQGGTRGAGRH